jgi:hypothetical protein
MTVSQITDKPVKKSKGKVFKFLETNENESKSYQNLWHSAQAILRKV